MNIKKDIYFTKALDLMNNSDNNLFITGKAGSGKSTLLSYFVNNTNKNIAVVAPTGVAALNVKGQTIHRLFHLPINVTVDSIKNRGINLPKSKKELYKKLEMLIIDEVSMVRADLLDCMDTFLRRYGKHRNEPFGGVQMVFIGDLYQLPPVIKKDEQNIFNNYYKTPYFFSSNVFNSIDLQILVLENIYRQTDKDFINLLNKIRDNTITNEELNRLNTMCNSNNKEKHEYNLTLTTTNAKANLINNFYLEKLNSTIYTKNAKIEGNVAQEYYPTSTKLMFKVGSQVMLLNNDTNGNWVNGSIGIIKSVHINRKKPHVIIKLKNNKEVVVFAYTWDIHEFYLKNNKILSKSMGKFTQFPFKLSWAVTIHKSQGQTFDNVTVDLDRGTFANGQVYVGLSRCTSIEGLNLIKPIKKRHIFTDPEIKRFFISSNN